MYTAFDFINTDVESKRMKVGWKIEPTRHGISLRHTMLNFDWKSTDFLGEEAWDLFLNSNSWKTFKEKESRAMRKFKRLYFEAMSISNLKMIVGECGLKIDIDKMVSREIARKSDNIKERRRKSIAV